MRWHSTGNGPADRSGEPPACFRNPKDLTKVITVIIKKRASGWIFRQLLRLHSFRFNQQKMLILPTNSRMQIHSQYVSWQYPRIFQTDRIAGSLLQRKLYRTDIWLFVFFFLCVWGPSLQQQFSIVTENCYWKITFKQGFSASVLLSSHRNLEKLCYFNAWKA